MEKKENINVNWLLKYWHIIMFCVSTFTLSIIGYSELKQKVYSEEAIAKTNTDIVNRHEIELSQQRVELQNIKETLGKIERQNEKLDNKIDKVLDVVISKNTK